MTHYRDDVAGHYLSPDRGEASPMKQRGALPLGRNVPHRSPNTGQHPADFDNEPRLQSLGYSKTMSGIAVLFYLPALLVLFHLIV